MKTVTFLKSTISHLGGLEKYALRLAQTFQNNGLGVRLITTGKADNIPQLKDVEVLSFDFKHKISALKVLQFNSFCENITRKGPSPIIFSLDRNTSQTHLRAGNGVHKAYLERRKKTEGIAKALSLSINPLHRLILSIEKKSFEDPKLQTLFTNSQMVKREILDHYNVDENKIEVVHNGVEWSQMALAFQEALSQKEVIAKQLCLDPSSYHFLFLGHNFRRKGLSELLDAFSALKHKDAHLSVVGMDKELELFKKKAFDLGVEKKVTFWGQRRDVISFYQMCDSLIIPSHYDPFANVTVEALAMGLYVVTSSSNGASEVLKDFAGEIITDLSSKEMLLTALQRAISRPKTAHIADKIRHSVAHLDFPNQLQKMYQKTIKDL